MAFIVPRANDTWEIRESRNTRKGPRSRTLATFRELTDEVVERARARAEGAFDDKAIRKAALRAGAPLAEPRADRLARELLGELARGERPQPFLRRLLADAFHEDAAPISDTTRSAADWIAATPQQRAYALNDLLLLGDALPQHRRELPLNFPRIDSNGS
jgi:hypothetical protein